MYHQVRLGESGIETVNLALAYPKKAMQRGAVLMVSIIERLHQEVAEPWAVITNETPTLQTLWQYGLRFRVEERTCPHLLFLD